MALKRFEHSFDPPLPDKYAKNRLFKAAEELGYVVLPKKDWSTLHELVFDRLTLIEDRPDDERDHHEEENLNEVLLGLNEQRQ